MRRHGIALAAGADDPDLRDARLAVHGDLAHFKSDLGGFSLVVVRHHEGESVTHVAEFAALAGVDGEEAQFGQLRLGIVQRGDADVLDRFALGEGHVELHEVEILAEAQRGIFGVCFLFYVLRHRLGLGNGLVDLAEKRLRAGKRAVDVEDAAEVRSGRNGVLKIPQIAPADCEKTVRGVVYVVPLPVPDGLPTVGGREDLFGNGESDLVILARVLGDVRADNRQVGGSHLALLTGDAQFLIRRHGGGVLIFNKKVLLS